MGLGCIFAPLWQSAHSSDSHSTSLLLSRFLFKVHCCDIWTASTVWVGECLSAEIIATVHLFYQNFPYCCLFLPSFLSYLSNNSPLGSERCDLCEEPSLKLLVQELWLSYFPITVNIEPPKLVSRTLQHALTCSVSSWNSGTGLSALTKQQHQRPFHCC